MPRGREKALQMVRPRHGRKKQFDLRAGQGFLQASTVYQFHSIFRCPSQSALRHLGTGLLLTLILQAPAPISMSMELPMLPIAMAAEVAAVAGVVLLIGIDIGIMLDVVPVAISIVT